MSAIDAFQCVAVREAVIDCMDLEEDRLCGRMCLTTTVLCDREHLSVLKDLPEVGAGSRAGVAQVRGIDSGDVASIFIGSTEPRLLYKNVRGSALDLSSRHLLVAGVYVQSHWNSEWHHHDTAKYDVCQI